METRKADTVKLYFNKFTRATGVRWLLGHFTAADIVMSALVIWANSLGLCEGHPVAQAYATRAKARPAWAADRA